MALALRLREFRLALGLSQAALARALDTHRTATVSDWERSVKTPPKPTLLALASLTTQPEMVYRWLLGLTDIRPRIERGGRLSAGGVDIELE
jgi:transcriptional regulator with XRE-family HTH domain